MKKFATVTQAILLACWIIVIVASCQPAQPSTAQEPGSGTFRTPHHEIERFIDREMGMVCYVVRYDGAISCQPTEGLGR